MVRVISLGAGVQSSAMLLMALEGRFGDMPDCAIFADTQWEPKAVYEWLGQLAGVAWESFTRSDGSKGCRTIPGIYHKVGIPVHAVTTGNIRDDYLNSAVPSSKINATHFAALPTFVRIKHDVPIFGEEQDENGDAVIIGWTQIEGVGMGRRQCSHEYKLTAIRRKIRELVGPNGKAESWIGISLDEAHRMKPSGRKWNPNRYPLIEARLRREDCQNYLIERVGSPAPKSSCLGCPFHDDAYWARLRIGSPDEFADVVEFDKQIRHQRGTRGEMFVHRSCQPLGDIKEFRHEKQGRMFLDGFGNECEGICGT
jgi:hypothetical protein